MFAGIGWCFPAPINGRGAGHVHIDDLPPRHNEINSIKSSGGLIGFGSQITFFTCRGLLFYTELFLLLSLPPHTCTLFLSLRPLLSLLLTSRARFAPRWKLF